MKADTHDTGHTTQADTPTRAADCCDTAQGHEHTEHEAHSGHPAREEAHVHAGHGAHASHPPSAPPAEAAACCAHEQAAGSCCEHEAGHGDAHADAHDGPAHAAVCCGDVHDTAHHTRMVTDYARRFWISTALTVPVLLLDPMVPEMLGLPPLVFPGHNLLLLALATVIYVYGGRPFISGLIAEVRVGMPGMMTLIALAVTVAWGYSTAVVLGLPGTMFFWELATLIDIMLLGHFIEMRSVMGASRALTELAALLPDTAHLVAADGSITEVASEQLREVMSSSSVPVSA